MLGPIFRVNARQIPLRGRVQGLATNLLSQPLDRLSLAEFKNEAKRRGLSASGNKATLITRIQHVEKRADSPTSIKPDDPNRGLATAAAGAPTPPRPAHPTLDVKLPDLSGPQEVVGPHIPFLPDFWDSSRARTADAIHHNPTSEAPKRKVLVVAGAATHHAGGPSFSPSHHSESDEDQGIRQTTTPAKTGFWRDVATDIGIPQSFDASASLTKAREAFSSIGQTTFAETKEHSSFQSRPLDAEEERGVWVLLGILGGSWLVGGLLSKSKKKDHS